MEEGEFKLKKFNLDNLTGIASTFCNRTSTKANSIEQLIKGACDNQTSRMKGSLGVRPTSGDIKEDRTNDPTIIYDFPFEVYNKN